MLLSRDPWRALYSPVTALAAPQAAGRGGPDALDLPPEEYARLLKPVSRAVATAEEAVAVGRVFAAISAIKAINGLLEEAVGQIGAPSAVRACSRATRDVAGNALTQFLCAGGAFFFGTGCYALAAQLRKRGVVAAAAVLADPASWAPGGAAEVPPAVAAVMTDHGVSSANIFLATLQQCMLQGVHGEARTTAISLDAALRVGAAAPPGSLARGLAACLLSYCAISLKDKDCAVERGAMTWLLHVAGAKDTYTPVVRARAIAGAGNIVRGARDAATIAPLLALLMRTLRRHVSRGFGMLRGDDVAFQFDVVHNAVFVFAQMAHFVELRPMMASRGVEEALMLLHVHASEEGTAHQEHLAGIKALIEQHVMRVLYRDPTLHLGGTPAEGAPDPGSVMFRTFGPMHQVAPVIVPMTDRCSACGTAATHGVHLKRCARCLEVRYCDAACQRRHWGMHKLQCGLKREE